MKHLRWSWILPVCVLIIFLLFCGPVLVGTYYFPFRDFLPHIQKSKGPGGSPHYLVYQDLHIPPLPKNLAVPHFHQVFGVIDWTEGRTFKSPVTGEEKSILYASCWPTCLVELLVYWQVVENKPEQIAQAIKRAYNAFADFDDGAHTDLIPDYLAKNYPKLYVRRVMVDDLERWPSERKWKIIKGAIDQGWPVAVSITWVKPRGKIYPHSFIIRGYGENGTKYAIVNDVSGSYTMTGKWDEAVTGEVLVYDYENFFDRYFLIVVPKDQQGKLDAFLKKFGF